MISLKPHRQPVSWAECRAELHKIIAFRSQSALGRDGRKLPFTLYVQTYLYTSYCYAKSSSVSF